MAFGVIHVGEDDSLSHQRQAEPTTDVARPALLPVTGPVHDDWRGPCPAYVDA